MQRLCSRFRPRNPDAFVVGSLFANGEQGVWFDPGDMNTLFQDSAGTIPVTASGQPVGLMHDKSGHGFHAAQTTAGSRPTFRDVNGLRYLEFDGTDDFLVTASIDFSATDEVNVFSSIRKLSDAAIGLVCELSANINTNNGAFNITSPQAAAANTAFSSKGTALVAAIGTGVVAPISLVATGIGDISADVSTLRLNGAVASATVLDQGSGNYGNFPLYIGRRGGATLPFNGHIYGLIIRGALSDSATTAKTERYMASKNGVTLS